MWLHGYYGVSGDEVVELRKLFQGDRKSDKEWRL